MINRSFGSSVWAASILVISASCASELSGEIIRVSIHSTSQYKKLSSGVGRKVCVAGVIKSDDFGVYFPLRPAEKNGLIRPSFSRIVVGEFQEKLPINFVNGKEYKVCGLMSDVTPFKKCENEDCRWYKLTDISVRNIR